MTPLYLGFLIGALLVVAGMLTHALAPRVGPNPIFGVRIGYAYASRDVWDRTNRFGGSLIVVVGVLIGILGLFAQVLSLTGSTGITLLTAATIILTIGSAVWMFLYARTLAQHTAMIHEYAPVRFRWAFVAPVLATFGLIVAAALYFYPQLPADRLATHFNWYEQADGWSTRETFLVTFLGLALLFPVLDLLVVWFAAREPLIAFSRWNATWRLDPDRGLLYMGLAFGLTNLILLGVLLDVVAFNLRGTHLFPLTYLLWAIIPLIVLLVALFFALGRRETQTA